MKRRTVRGWQPSIFPTCEVFRSSPATRETNMGSVFKSVMYVASQIVAARLARLWNGKKCQMFDFFWSDRKCQI